MVRSFVRSFDDEGVPDMHGIGTRTNASCHHWCFGWMPAVRCYLMSHHHSARYSTMMVQPKDCNVGDSRNLFLRISAPTIRSIYHDNNNNIILIRILSIRISISRSRSIIVGAIRKTRTIRIRPRCGCCHCHCHHITSVLTTTASNRIRKNTRQR